jgi:hypothetical protein
MNKSARAFAVLVFAALVATPVAAAEIQVAGIPIASSYTATAVLVPGCGGGEVMGGKSDGHVIFRVAFGADGQLNVNGCQGGEFNPAHTYRVTVHSEQVLCLWFATTEVLNETTGAVEFLQVGFRFAPGAEQVTAVAEDVISLSVE